MKQPVRKNDDIELTMDAYTSEGAGIGRINGFAVFCPGALVGEKVACHIIKVTSSYAVGKLISVIEKNEKVRQAPICPVYEKCGGCSLQHMNYESQLEFKRGRVEQALRKIGGVEFDVPPVLPSDKTDRYRNKASFPFAEVDGKVRLGFFAQRSHRLIPLFDCPIQSRDTVIAMQTAEKWANEHKISAYDEQKGDGILRHLVVRSTTEGVLCCIVTSGNALPYGDRLADELSAKYSEAGINFIGLIHNVNPKATNVILGNRFKTVSGSDEQTESLCGLDFSVRTPSFLQVNHAQTEVLYKTALDFLSATQNETVFDVYCGVGTMTLLAAKTAGKAIGIEYVPEAVGDAKKNAERNGIENAEFIAGAAERILPELVEKGQTADAVLLDPPRSGADKDVLTAIAKSGAKRIVYVSCNPETLARDVKILAEQGYMLQKVQSVDMFPQTGHVETIALITRAE